MTLYIKNATFIDWQSLIFTKTDIELETSEPALVNTTSTSAK